MLWSDKMAKRYKKSQDSQSDVQELAIVTYADNWEQAKEYEALLKNNDIPAVIKEQAANNAEDNKDIVVMVSEEFIDEAHVVIESQDAYDDFYDLTLEEDDYDFDDDDFLEDDF